MAWVSGCVFEFGGNNDAVGGWFGGVVQSGWLRVPARLRFRGRDAAFLLLIGTMMLPPQVTMIPMFIMFQSFGWIDTFLPLVVPLFFGDAVLHLHVSSVFCAGAGGVG